MRYHFNRHAIKISVASGVVLGGIYGASYTLVKAAPSYLMHQDSWSDGSSSICREAFMDVVRDPWKKFLPLHLVCELAPPRDGVYLMKRLRDRETGGISNPGQYRRPAAEPVFIG